MVWLAVRGGRLDYLLSNYLAFLQAVVGQAWQSWLPSQTALGAKASYFVHLFTSALAGALVGRENR